MCCGINMWYVQFPELFSGDTGCCYGNVKYFCNGCVDRSLICFFVPKNEVVCCNAPLFIGWSCQIGNH